MRSWSHAFRGGARCSFVLPLVCVGMMAASVEAQPRQDRPFVIKPDGIVQRPNMGIREPDLDAAWVAYTAIADASVRRLADECFADEREALLQHGVLPIIPRQAVKKYWAEVDGARDTLRGAYGKHENPTHAMSEWTNDIETQIPRRFPDDGEYLLIEDPVTRRGRVLRVGAGRVAWDQHNVMPDGSLRKVPGKAVPLPATNGQDSMAIAGLVNPENGKKIKVSIDCLLQAYELHLTEPDGRHIAEIAGRIVALSDP